MSPKISVLCILSLVQTTLAQDAAHLPGRLRPVTSEVRDAGTLHLGTGTWTRRGSPQALLGGSSIVYANTCTTGYFGAMIRDEVWTDEGTLPDEGMPVQASTTIPGENDTAPGCAVKYSIRGFQIAYCTNSTLFDATIAFHDQYQTPGALCTPPGAPTASFVLTGLPASNGAAQACWLVSLDLTATSATFSLTGTGNQPKQFGWSFSLQHSPVGLNTDGPVIAGGQAIGASYADCPGTGGTIWGDPAIAGTGMLTQDAFRLDCSTCTSPGCYYFLANPIASFHLELYSDVDCGLPPLGQSLCHPGLDGVATCPCGNAPTSTGAGCDNSVPTGGGTLTATSITGHASVANDQVVLTATSVRPNTTSLFLQGNARISAGAHFGDGVRCVGGLLLRLNSPGGTPSDGVGSVSYPNAGFPQSITARAASLGQPIAAGSSRWYTVYYRDPVLTFCPSPPGNSWNVTQTFEITWVP